MRKSSGILVAACLLVAVPAFAGNLTFDRGQTIWHSTQCTRPAAPGSVLNAAPETAGDDMNTLVAKHNAFVALEQAYMECLSGEAERDQSMVGQAITSGAQKAISDAQADVDNNAAAMRSHQK